jgi:multidrug transporter EmrE-like cation transporter
MFGVALLFYSLALTKLPLNVAHPILTSGAVGAVALMSFFIFGEEFYWSTLIGLALLLAGVLMITVRV